MRHFRFPIPFALLFALAASQVVYGTNRYYKDLSILSSDGKLRLEAKSPDNADGKLRAFAKNYQYTLFELLSGKPIWSRKQSKNEGSPIRAFVNLDGIVAVWTGYHDLMVVKANGDVALKLPILETALPADDIKSFVRETTAGPMWANHSHWYFFALGDQQYFAIRTWWDRRIIVSLASNKQVSDEGAIRERAEYMEKKFVLDTLERGAEVAREWEAQELFEISHPDRGPWNEVENLRTAIHMAGRMKVKEAASFLLEIEKIRSFDSSSMMAMEETPEGQLMLAAYSRDSTRTNVQLALRRIGKKPTGFPAIEMRIAKKDSMWGEKYQSSTHTTPRAERIADVSDKMSPKEVVDKIGEPDYVGNGGWEYDVDADSPYTFRIVWKGSQMVSNSKISPPVWQDSKIRDMQR